MPECPHCHVDIKHIYHYEVVYVEETLTGDTFYDTMQMDSEECLESTDDLCTHCHKRVHEPNNPRELKEARLQVEET